MEGFPGGSVLKNPTASAGDNEFNLWRGKIPNAGEKLSAMRHNDWAWNRNYWAHVLQLLRPMHPRACAQQKEMPTQWEARAPKLERVAPTPCN